MVQVNIQKTGVVYNKELNSFVVSGKKVSFGSSYELYNEKTGNKKVFELSHSTGSEWDPNTVWIYKNGEMKLIVTNDDVTKEHAENYLKAKLR